MHVALKKQSSKQGGFSVIEVLVAMVLLIVGLVAVAQLVPLSIRLNTANRDDSTALVFAQRELNAMFEQPLTATSFTDPQGFACSLGDPAQPKVPVGSPLTFFNGKPVIDFSQAQVAGYSLNYRDPNDPFRVTYDIRWAVIAYTNAGGTVTGKRFIMGGVRRTNNAPLQPVTIDTMVEK